MRKPATKCLRAFSIILMISLISVFSSRGESTVYAGEVSVTNTTSPFILCGDLEKYAVNMIGQPFFTVCYAYKVDEETISALMDRDSVTTTFNMDKDYSNMVNVGDCIAISGVIDSTEQFFTINEINMENCSLIAVGDNAEQLRQSSTDSSYTPYLTMNKDVVKWVGKKNISEWDYKSMCQYLSYEDILRNPSAYEGVYVIVEGTVDQIIEGFLSDSLYIVDGFGNKWGCSYKYKDGESHYLEGDYALLYGECNGTGTSRTLLGEQVTMPSVTVEYRG